MPPEVCQHHDAIMARIEAKLDAVLERLSKGDVTFATTVLRVDQIEKVVYGAMGLALTAVAGAVLALVIKTHP